MSLKELEEIARTVNGKIDEVGILPDGSGFATMSMPLPDDHWIFNGKKLEEGTVVTGEPPAPFRVGEGQMINVDLMSRNEFAEKIREAGKYAVQASTMCGKEEDFDPDAMLQNFIVGMLGYWTRDGYPTMD